MSKFVLYEEHGISEIKRLRAEKDILVKALKDIIAECPKPKLPYAVAVVEIANKAICQVIEA